MDSVIATGNYRGDVITVIVSKENDQFSITFNGLKDQILQDRVEMIIEKLKPIGGTYHMTKNDLLGWYCALNEKFFDKLIHIIVEGEMESIPFDDDPNIIY